MVRRALRLRRAAAPLPHGRGGFELELEEGSDDDPDSASAGFIVAILLLLLVVVLVGGIYVLYKKVLNLEAQRRPPTNPGAFFEVGAVELETTSSMGASAQAGLRTAISPDRRRGGAGGSLLSATSTGGDGRAVRACERGTMV